MLRTARVYIYVVDRDFGFAPNPFHGFCTLATCKPAIRKGASIGDWVIGIGGSRLRRPGRMIYAMNVTNKLSFNEYWSNPWYFDKRPVRNGSLKMLVGDNIYHFDAELGAWHQADSHHSNPDGSMNNINVANDTKADAVLISRHFYYFGSGAPIVPVKLLSDIGYANRRSHRVFSLPACRQLISWLTSNHSALLNQVGADPVDFEAGDRRYSAGNDKIT